MSPLSVTFFCFAALGWAVSSAYKNNPDQRTRALAVLTSAFWWWVGGWDLLVMLCVSGWVFFVVKAVNRAKSRTLVAWLRRAGVVGALLPLGFFKVIPEMTGWVADVRLVEGPFENWWQPLGIAVLSLQAVMCIVDVARRDSGNMSLSEAVLVCGFFPRAVAGPLARTERIVAQLRSAWDGNVNIQRVAVLVAAAAFKRYVLIESMMNFDAVTTASNADLGWWDAVWHLAVGPVLLVVDVSAYTDLAMAAALMCGIVLPPNFNAPFAGWTVGEMWRRWHMSVSGFFRDYVIAPVSGGKSSATRQAAAIYVGVCAIGLWHVAYPTMLLWSTGLAVPLIIEVLHGRSRSKKVGRSKRRKPTGAVRWLRALGVFGYVALLGQLFHGAGVGDWWRSVASVTHFGTPSRWADWWVVLCILCGWGVGAGLFQRLGEAFERALWRMPAWFVGAFLAVTVTACAAMADGGIPRFYYQRLG